MDTQVSRLRKKIERDPGDPAHYQDRMGRRLPVRSRKCAGNDPRRRQTLSAEEPVRADPPRSALGLVVSNLIGAWIYAGAREQAVRAIGGFAAAQRVANLSRLIDEAPADWRPRIAQALNDPTFHVSLSSQPPDPPPPSADGPAASDQGPRATATPRLARSPSARRRLRPTGAARRPLDSRSVLGQMNGMSGMMAI